jgi:YheC/D like ATP-grasp
MFVAKWGISVLVALTGVAPDGLLHARRKWTFLQLGRAAAEFGLPMMVATPAEFQSHRRRISGRLYCADDGESPWQHAEIPWSRHAVVYDAMYLSDLQLLRTSFHQLRHALHGLEVPVFNPVLPPKDTIYRALSARPLKYGVLPETRYDLVPDGVLQLFKSSPQWWLKPVYGSGGRNILFVQRLKPGRYLVAGERFFGQRLTEEVNRRELKRILCQAMERRRYMAQQHIPLVTSRDGRKVDFRVTVQRNETGAWDMTAMTARLSAKGSMLTNYHAGGAVRSLTHSSEEDLAWMARRGIPDIPFGHVREFALSVAKRLQQKYPLLGSLGIDVGRSVEGTWYVYDCNGRPGRDILTDQEIQTFVHSVAGFARYLLDHSSRRFTHRHALDDKLAMIGVQAPSLWYNENTGDS